MEVSVFCSANEHLDPEFYELTEALGKLIAERGHKLVFGGTNLGLMEAVARGAHLAGGVTVGVIPSIVEKRGCCSEHVDVAVWCDNLSDRKDLMIDRSDVLIALPGGVGTLDEVFTVLASSSIGYHHKKVLLYNMKGFWTSLITMMDDLQKQGVIRGNWRDTLVVVDSLEQISAYL